MKKTSDGEYIIRCQSKSPIRGEQCEMANGHYGPHHNGNVSWTIKCEDKECVYKFFCKKPWSSSPWMNATSCLMI